MAVTRHALVALLLVHWVAGQTKPTISNIHLANGNATAGRVEVMMNSGWGTVCDDGWDNQDAAVVCRQLGLSGGVALVRAAYGQGNASWPILVDDTACVGSESRLDECSYVTGSGVNCQHSEDAAVVCGSAPASGQTTLSPATTTPKPGATLPSNCTGTGGQVRLYGTTSQPAGVGYVQVRTDPSTWGFVCDDGLDVNVAKVICKELCYTDMSVVEPGIKTEYQMTIANPVIVLDDVSCRGNETQLLTCQHAALGTSNCGPTELMAVTCVQQVYSLPPQPSPILECQNGDLIALFNRSWSSLLEEKFLSIADPYTGNCNFRTDATPDFISARISFEQCGTIVQQNATHIIYRNAILIQIETGAIARATYRVELECDMPRNATVDKNVQPLTETVTQRSLGQFIITMTLYNDTHFLTPVAAYPYRITMGGWVNAAVELLSVDSRLKLVVTDCWSTPNTSVSTSPTYPLYQNKCVVQGSTLETYPLSQVKFGLRLQPVSFVGYPYVSLQCKAVVCLNTEVTQECDRSCNNVKPAAAASGRRRRDADTRTVYVISTDFIVFAAEEPWAVTAPSTAKITMTSPLPSSTTTTQAIVTAALGADPKTEVGSTSRSSPAGSAVSSIPPFIPVISTAMITMTSPPPSSTPSSTVTDKTAVLKSPSSGSEENSRTSETQAAVGSVYDGNSAVRLKDHAAVVTTLSFACTCILTRWPFLQ